MTGSFTTATADTPAPFYSSKNKGGSGQGKDRCKHCNWAGHKKENCYKLVGYPSGHRLYKGKGGNGGTMNDGNQKHRVGNQNQHSVHNSITESTNASPASTLTFTPYQCQQIIQLLSKTRSEDVTS
ncbi:hypothetical protein CFOL_v3_22293 [Cephalotus follicularis]|uniref:CCHC-type domain-containing protein n=1 Tax=Cephalotus follicularis TaxID=3775 RepID=A0A1Q3CFE8_CEPFO|nr:hypothetical protein CFOL_v3_22293 [Cephalotus follicularis]